MTSESATGARLMALALAWLAGTALHLRSAELPPEWATWTVAVAGILALLVAIRSRAGRRGRGVAPVAGLAAALLLAYAAAGLRAAARLAEALPPELEGEELQVTGQVASLPQRTDTGLNFVLAVESAMQAGAPVRLPPAIQVGWYAAKRGAGDAAGQGAGNGAGPRDLGAGERWSFTLRLRRPHGLANPGGGDPELRMFEQRVGATATVRPRPAPQRLGAASGHPVERLRQHVRGAIQSRVRDSAAAGLLVALSVGDQGALQPAQWRLYRSTGIAHLVAISGLHVALFSTLAAAVLRRLWCRSRRALAWWPAPLAGAWLGLGCAAAYALVSGGGLPAQRTVWMLAVVTASRSVGVHWPRTLVLLVAAAVVSAFDPWALLQPGFWLSFGAVGLLVVSSAPAHAARPADDDRPGPAGRLQAAGRSLWATVRTQAVVGVGLAPLTLLFFQQVSLVGFGANLLAIPLVTLLVLPLALLGCVLPALWSVAAWVVGPFHALLGVLAQTPGAVWSVALAPAWAQAAGLLGAALMVVPLPWRLRALAAVLLGPLLLPARDLPPPGGFDLVAPDVGQGTAVLVRTRGHLLVFDAGPRDSPRSDAGERVLVPLLRQRGEHRIDRLVLSHRDTDHVGGAAAVFDAVPVALLSSSLEPGHPLLGRAAASRRCEAGEAWDWDGVHFEMLQPPPASFDRRLRPNARSCVLRVSAPGRSVLLTGDIERAQEAALVAARPEGLRSDWLFAPHHGSKTSSSAPFLDAVAPRGAVFQAGYRNRFGHPAPAVLARYRDRGIRIVESPGCGAFTLRWVDDGAGRCWRDAHRRYWHHPG